MRLIGILGVATLVAAGCASAPMTGEVTVLESRVEHLEQRLQRLERQSGITPAPQARQAAPAPAPAQAPAAAAPAAAPVEAAPPGETLAEMPTIQEVQQALKNAGFYQGEVDGKMGPITKGAIREFQRVNGLQVDGDMGLDTWNRLRKHLTPAG